MEEHEVTSGLMCPSGESLSALRVQPFPVGVPLLPTSSSGKHVAGQVSHLSPHSLRSLFAGD